MKKLLLTGILTLSFTVVPTKKAHALISGGGSSFAVVNALYMIAGGTVFFASTAGIQSLKNKVKKKYKKAGLTVIQVLGVIVGAMLLDDEGNLTDFSTVDKSLGKMIQEEIKGIKAIDIETYNSEVEELNSILADIEINELRKDGKVTRNDVIEALDNYDLSKSTIKVAGVLSALVIK